MHLVKVYHVHQLLFEMAYDPDRTIFLSYYHAKKEVEGPFFMYSQGNGLLYNLTDEEML
jgi:hypothetical protein